MLIAGAAAAGRIRGGWFGVMARGKLMLAHERLSAGNGPLGAHMAMVQGALPWLGAVATRGTAGLQGLLAQRALSGVVDALRPVFVPVSLPLSVSRMPKSIVRTLRLKKIARRATKAIER